MFSRNLAYDFFASTPRFQRATALINIKSTQPPRELMSVSDPTI
jgi:hypothetical protein